MSSAVSKRFLELFRADLDRSFKESMKPPYCKGCTCFPKNGIIQECKVCARKRVWSNRRTHFHNHVVNPVKDIGKNIKEIVKFFSFSWWNDC